MTMKFVFGILEVICLNLDFLDRRI